MLVTNYSDIKHSLNDFNKYIKLWDFAAKWTYVIYNLIFFFLYHIYNK